MFTQGSQMWMGGIHATNLVEVTDDASQLDDGSFWAISISFEGKATFARFADVTKNEFPKTTWESLGKRWMSSLSQSEYISYVSTIREIIAAGGVSSQRMQAAAPHDDRCEPVTSWTLFRVARA